MITEKELEEMEARIPKTTELNTINATMFTIHYIKDAPRLIAEVRRHAKEIEKKDEIIARLKAGVDEMHDARHQLGVKQSRIRDNFLADVAEMEKE